MTMDLNSKKKRALYENRVILESINEFKKHYKVSIRQMFLDHISKSDGFDENDLGTQYLASLMAILYHERRLYYADYNYDFRSYYDLSDENNKHFSMFGVDKDTFIDEINKSIEKNPYDDGPLNELVYDVVDYFIYTYGLDRDNKYKKRYGLMRK